MLFDLYKIEKCNNAVKIYAERLVQFDALGNEVISRGTPKWWDDCFVHTIDMKMYDIYFLCTHTITHGFYNRVTDYKKIWGLNKLEQGIYDNSYCNEVGKVYFGITKSQDPSAFHSDKASTILMIPSKGEIWGKEIFQILKINKYNFRVPPALGDEVLSEIQKMHKKSILLRYVCDGEISLTIYGDYAENIDFRNNIYKHKNQEDVIYRKP